MKIKGTTIEETEIETTFKAVLDAINNEDLTIKWSIVAGILSKINSADVSHFSARNKEIVRNFLKIQIEKFDC